MNIHHIGLLAMLAFGANAEDIREETTWQQTYPVSAAAPHLFVRNIWGDVSVRTGAPGEISITVNERHSAPTRELLARSKDRLRLNVDPDSAGLSMIVGDPDRTEGRMNQCRGCRAEYQLDITVPPTAVIDVGTVTDGRIEVTGVRGPVNASNVNGPVAVRGLNDCANIESVNGALDVVFANTPGENCSIKTINGRITVGLPANAGLDAILSVTHGDVVSDFDVEPLSLPTQLQKEQDEARFGYRLEQPTGVRVGAGGPTFTFASLNGDVRIRKNP